jgi:hypothetical protein
VEQRLADTVDGAVAAEPVDDGFLELDATSCARLADPVAEARWAE